MKFYIDPLDKNNNLIHDNPDLVLNFNIDMMAHLCNLTKYKYEEQIENVLKLSENNKKVMWEKPDGLNKENIIEYTFNGFSLN